ncbi:MAG: hypothetical protein Q9170_006827 [Blastenia crenularia]
MEPLREAYTLTVRQGPEQAKVASSKEKERKPVDPPPIVQLNIRDALDPSQDALLKEPRNYLQSPYLFMCVNLCHADLNKQPQLVPAEVLSGTLVSSLHRLKDIDNADGGFFVFGDLSVKVEGEYRLRFSLFEMLKKRPPSSLRSDELPPTFEDPSPLAQRGTTLQSQREPMGMYNSYAGAGEPAAKRQKTSVDLNDRGLFDQDRYTQRPYMNQRASYATYAARDQTGNMFSPAYSQGAHSALSNVSDYSYGHQRNNSSNTSSPFVSPHTEISGHTWPSTNMYYPTTIKDTSFTYPPNQFTDVQLGRSSQLAEPFMRQRAQNFTDRFPAANMNFSFPRSQEMESPAASTYSQVTKPLPLSSQYSDPPPRLPPSDQIASPNRQHYSHEPISNVLPPLESTVSSNLNRRGSQQILPTTILPSIEPQTLAPSPIQPVEEHAQESFEGHENYDTSSFEFSMADQKRGLQQHVRQHRDDAAIPVPSRTVEVKIHAQWDGNREHAVRIEGQPATRLGLIDTNNPLIASQSIHSTVHEWIADKIPVSKAITGHVNDLSGDTLTPSVARDYLQHFKREESHDIDDWASVGEATKTVKHHDPSEVSSSSSRSQALYEPDKYDLFTNQAIGLEGAASRSDTCLSTRPSSSQNSSSREVRSERSPKAPFSLQLPEGRYPKPDSIQELKHLQRMLAYKKDSSLATPTRQSRKLTAVRCPPKDYQYRQLSRCVTPGILSRPPSIHQLSARASGSRRWTFPGSAPGSPQVYGNRPLSVPLIQRPLVRSDENFQRQQVTVDAPELKSLPSSKNIRDPQSSTLSPLLSTNSKFIMRPAYLASPNEYPMSWLYRRFCSAGSITLRRGTRQNTTSQSSSGVYTDEAAVGLEPGWASDLDSIDSGQTKPIGSLADTYGQTPPSTVLCNERIYACFPEQTSTGIYDVQLDMELFMSQPDALNWQNFGLPSLLIENCNEIKGLIEFSMVSRDEDNMSAVPAQFKGINSVVLGEVHERWLKASFSINEALLFRVRPCVESHRLNRWTGAVTIYSTMCGKQTFGMNVKHNASLTVKFPHDDVFAKRVVFAILIKNGPQHTRLYRMKSGQSLVQLPESKYTANQMQDPVEILFERDFQDMGMRLGVEFACNYADATEASIALPVISPNLGNLLSENIWLLKPSEPLKLHAVCSRPYLSTWNISKRTLGKRELLCFNRVEMPKLFPNDLADDPVVHVRRLRPVWFNGFPEPEEDFINRADALCDIIKSLHMAVDIVHRKRLECRLFFDLEVGSKQRLVRIDAPGWQPNYALINGRLCTNRTAQWLVEDLQQCLFQQPWMVPGTTLQIEVSFVVNTDFDECLWTGKPVRPGQWVETAYPLPMITDKIILGGNLTCSHHDTAAGNDTVISIRRHCSDGMGLDHEELRFSNYYGEDSRRLPSMNIGYKLKLYFWIPRSQQYTPPDDYTLPQEHTPPHEYAPSRVDNVRFSGGLPLSPRVVRFEDERSDTSNDGDDEWDDLGSPNVELEEKSAPSASSQLLEENHYMDAQSSSDSHLDNASIAELASKHIRRPARKSNPDKTRPPGPFDTRATPLIIKTGDVFSSDDEDSSETATEDVISYNGSTDCDRDDDYAIERQMFNVNDPAGGEDIPDSSDEHSSEATDQEHSDHGDEDGFLPVAVREAIQNGFRLFDILINAIDRFLLYIERRSPMQYLFRFFLVEFVVFLVMPESYFGGQPARAVQSVASNVFGNPVQMFLGDLEPPVRTMSDATLEQILPNFTPAYDVGHSAEEASAQENSVAEETIPRPRSQSLRDRIDVALGWRPTP